MSDKEANSSSSAEGLKTLNQPSDIDGSTPNLFTNPLDKGP